MSKFYKIIVLVVLCVLMLGFAGCDPNSIRLNPFEIEYAVPFTDKRE